MTTPRRWQVEALNAWRSTRRGVVSVVTGGGKTAFALMCLRDFLREFPLGQCIVIVPTMALMDQWAVALREDWGFELNSLEVFSGAGRPDKLGQVNVAVVNSAREGLPQSPRDIPRMIIVDECHRVGSTRNALALKGAFVARLGLSATPVREYDDGFTQLVVPVLGPIIYEYSYVQALADGVVAPFTLSNVKVDLLPSEREEYQRISRALARAYRSLQAGTGSADVIKRLLLKRARVASSAKMRIPVTVKLLEQSKAGQQIIFHESIAAANAIDQILRARGIASGVYHSQVAPEYRQQNLALFRSGLLDVLVTCRALDEGINVPEARIAIISSSTRSKRQRIQRLGRVLRPAQGKAMAHVYSIYAVRVEEDALRAEAAALEGVSVVNWLRARGPSNG